jgi:hypothetical protein
MDPEPAMIERPQPEEIPRVLPREVRERIESGADVRLVCAYDDEEKCRELALEGAVALAELERRDLDPAVELVFYCA